jgi:hypothetical protein
MLIKLTFKTPDVVAIAAADAVEYLEPKTEQELQQFHDVDDNLEYWREDRQKEIEQQLARWIEYGENVTIKFDLTAGTATVVQASR